MAALLCLFFGAPVASVMAVDERSEMLTASVEVPPIFSLSLPNAFLPFNNLQPGKMAVLGNNGYFNEARCRSNSGRSWYLKVQALMLRHAQQATTLPASSLKLRVAELTGGGEVRLGRNDFDPLSDEPVVLYLSRDADNEGQEVILRFQYGLLPPTTAPAGNYVGQVVFTMAESL